MSPLEAVQKLTQACLPANGASIDCYIEKLGATIEDGVNLAKSAFGDFADGAGLVKIIDNFFKRLTGDVGNEICFLRVGNWLSGFFVIKSADFTYSREIAVDGGPYYIDFDVQFETLIIPTKGDISLTGDASAAKSNMFNIGSTPSSRVEIEKQCVKPLGCEEGQSTGDLTIEYRIKDSNSEWIKSNLAIELKKSTDAFSSLYMKANRDRLFLELDRGKKYGLDFYFIVTDSLSELTKKIHKIAKFRNSNVENTHFDMMLKLDDKLRECGFNGVIVSGNDLTWCIKRVIKHHIKKNKLQYF